MSKKEFSMKKYIISLAFLMSSALVQGAVVNKTANVPTQLKNPSTVELQPVKVEFKAIEIKDLNVVKDDLNNFLNQVAVAPDPLQKLQEISKITTKPVLSAYFKNLSEAYKKALESENPQQAAQRLRQYLAALQQKIKEASSPETKAAIKQVQDVKQRVQASNLNAQELLSVGDVFNQALEMARRGQALVEEFSKVAQPVLGALEIYRQLQAISGVGPVIPGGGR